MKSMYWVYLVVTLLGVLGQTFVTYSICGPIFRCPGSGAIALWIGLPILLATAMVSLARREHLMNLILMLTMMYWSIYSLRIWGVALSGSEQGVYEIANVPLTTLLAISWFAVLRQHAVARVNRARERDLC